MFYKNFDHRFRVSREGGRIETELFEEGILPHQILDRIFQSVDDVFQFLPSGWFLDVKDDFVLDSEFLSDRQGILRGSSVREVVDGDFLGHGDVLLYVLGGGQGFTLSGDLKPAKSRAGVQVSPTSGNAETVFW